LRALFLNYGIHFIEDSVIIWMGFVVTLVMHIQRPMVLLQIKKVKRHRIAPICTYIENMVKYDQAKK
jgi:hypothetical protein